MNFLRPIARRLYRQLMVLSHPRVWFYHPAAVIPPRELLSLPWPLAEDICRQRAKPVYVGDRQVMSRLLSQYKFLTSTDDVGFAPHIFMDGYWEIWLTRFISRRVREGWTAIDIGANYGYYSVLLADLVGAHGRLVAFEPNPNASEALSSSLSVNGFASRSTVHTAAVSESSGTAKFFVPQGEPKNARLVGDHEPLPPGESFDTPIRCLDEFDLQRLDFIKIDAEGGELGIFKGMTQTIAKHNPLLVLEFNAARPGAEELAQRLQQTYTQLQYLTVRGRVRPVSSEAIQTQNVGEDWLLILQR